MSNKTLFFEEIAKGTVITTNSVERFPKRPTNNSSSSDAYKYMYQVGRDGQTEGNYKGDNLPHIPACAYHMPRNDQRFNEPRIFLPHKKKGDLIQSSDLNKLFDRIELFLYAWNAEFNDIYNYGIVNKLRNPEAKNYLNQITSEGQLVTETKFNEPSTNPKNMDSTNRILDPEVLGVTTIEANRRNDMYFKTYRSEKLQDILDKFNEIDSLKITSVDLNEYLTHPIGSIMPFGIPVREMGNESTGASNYETHIIKQNESGDSDSSINATTQDTSLLFSRPKNSHGFMINYGKTQLIPATLELVYTATNQYHYQYNIDITNATPTYWTINLEGTDTVVTLNNNNKSEFIFTYRDFTEDPLNPKLYYIGTKIFPKPLETIFNSTTITDSGSNIKIIESDITYNEAIRYKIGKYPVIKANEWNKTRLTIKTLLDRILSVSNITFGPGIDSTTKFEIETFYSQQTGFSTNVDLDNPETVFLNYQAVPGAIIKVEFYNTLIDAYKLMVNSCICNSDCFCNINCVCNTNCGCNYGG